MHFALDICHLKNSELEPTFQTYRGRVALRVDIVKDIFPTWRVKRSLVKSQKTKTAHAYRASPSTVLTDAIAPSAPEAAGPSRREQLNVRAAAQPSNPCHRRSQAAHTWPSIQGSAPRAFAAAKHLRNTLASADQRPPTSTPNTTNLARQCSPVNSGYVSSFLRLARARDFPFVVAVPR